MGYNAKMLTEIINAPLDELLNEANRVRSEVFGNDIDFCAIVNIKSGRCAMDCRFCAQSKHHATSVATYPLLHAEKLLAETHQLWNQNIPRVGWVSSGGTQEDIDQIVNSATTLLERVSIWSGQSPLLGERGHIADRVECPHPSPLPEREGATFGQKNVQTDLGHALAADDAKQLCASLGQLKTPELRQLRDAGFCRYHHNLETSERFYPSICTTQRWRDRRATVERVKELGWSVCSGGLFGLGETWEDRLQLALTLKELEVDSVPINFFSPIPGTPLADRTVLTPDEALRIVVLFRLTLPKATIRICGGRPAVFAERKQDALLLQAGANAFMTGNYLTTSGISPEKDMDMLVLC